MNHFASTAGTFQGKKDDGFKPATAASSDTPAWLSEAPAPSWKPSRAPVEGGTWQASATPAPAPPAPATSAPAPFTPATSAPATPAPATPAPARARLAPAEETPDAAVTDGFMNHFASTAGTFQGKKDADPKPASTSSDTPEWMSQ